MSTGITEPETGGPAFPTTNDALSHGMTLRDWFAGQALAGAIAESGMDVYPEFVAEEAYQLADAMLKARRP